MTEIEFFEYKAEIERRFGKCKVLTANQDTTLKNCNEKENDTAENGLAWIDYWRAMTGNHESRLFCSSCGQVIFVGEVPKIMKELYVTTGDSVEWHKAMGGHVLVNSPENGKYPGGKYITPLCPHCVNKRGEMIPIIKGSRICQEFENNSQDNQ